MAETAVDNAKYRRLRANGVPHAQAVAMAAVTPTVDFSPPSSLATDLELSSALAVKARLSDALAPRYQSVAPVTTMTAQAHTAGHGWTTVSGTINLNDTTTQVLLGSQAVKLTSNGAGGNTRIAKAGLTLDMTGKDPVIWVLVNDRTHLNDIGLYLGDSTLANYFFWDADRGTDTMALPGVPLKITLSWASATVVGTPNRAAIAKAQVLVVDDAAGTVDVWFGGLGAQTPAASATGGVCVFTFDDGYNTQVTAQQYLDKYAYLATYYPIVDLVDTAGYLTLAQLKLLQFAGHDISCHAYYAADHNLTHGFVDLTPAQLTAEFTAMKQWAVDNGFRGHDHFAYPRGQHNAAVVAEARRWFGTARTTMQTARETLPPADPHRIRIRGLDNQLTLAQAKTAVDAAKNGNGIVVFMSHKLGATVDSLTWVTSDFTQLVDYVNSQGLQVKTMSAALRL